LPLEEVEEIEESLECDEGLRYRYRDSKPGKRMVKFHVDEHPSFQDRVSMTKYGGNLSVRKTSQVKPLICFGQDECIFKQFLLTPKAWTAPDGQKAMIQKDEGLGVMISAFVSLEMGFGYDISEEDLVKVNEKGKYRCLPLSEKRRKENFRNSVWQSLDRGEVLTFERQRMFSKPACQYMLAYHSIELSKAKGESEVAGESKMSAYLVEKIIKTYKSHRGATDFDSAYIDAIVNDMGSTTFLLKPQWLGRRVTVINFGS
jgi:hypothetical protein